MNCDLGQSKLLNPGIMGYPKSLYSMPVCEEKGKEPYKRQVINGGLALSTSP